MGGEGKQRLRGQDATLAAGQLGLGDTDDRHTHTRIPDVTGVKSAAAGMYHSLLVLDDGSWGNNYERYR